jgi:hypothetical protein
MEYRELCFASVFYIHEQHLALRPIRNNHSAIGKKSHGIRYCNTVGHQLQPQLAFLTIHDPMFFFLAGNKNDG